MKEGIIKILFNVFVQNNPNDMCVLVKLATAASALYLLLKKEENNNNQKSCTSYEVKKKQENVAFV